jgi:hypothetical protein
VRRFLRLERRHEPRAGRHVFLLRQALYVGLATALMGGSLGVGMWGYVHYEGLAWRDAFLNAAMLLGGMGPIESPQTPGGKLFAGLYALYSGLVFLVAVAMALAPVFHRVMHSFHARDARSDDGAS